MKASAIAIILLLCSFFLWAQETDDSGDIWPDRLEPKGFEIGLFPNDSGGMDFLADGTVRWTNRLSSGIYASYSTSTSTYEQDSVEGTANQRWIDFSLDGIKWIFPIVTGDSFAFSIEPGVNIQYDNNYLETYGYRTNSDDSITFYRYEATEHKGIASVFSEFTLLFGDFVSLDVRGNFNPLIYIHEVGNKQYSGLDSPAEFTTQNLALGVGGAGALTVDFDEIFGLPIGRLNLEGGYYRQFGKYTSENVIVLDNWITTIVDSENMVETTISIGGSYDLTVAKKWISFVPSISVLYTLERERFGSTTVNTSGFKIGFSTKL